MRCEMMMVVLFFRNEAKFVGTGDAQKSPIDWLEKLCAAIANWVVPRYRAMALLSLAAAAICVLVHLQLEPRFRLSEGPPRPHWR